MKKPNDITGRRFGMLAVLGYDHSFNRNTYWLCKCECGNILYQHDPIPADIAEKLGSQPKEGT